jgi:hypothetical protein
MSRNVIAPLLAAVALFTGCEGHLFYTPLVASPHPLPPRPPATVETFVVTPPARPHTNIGFLQGTGRLADRGVDDAITRVRDEAARLGCDGIIILSIDRRAGRHGHPSVEASCFIYTAPSAAPPGATPPPSGPLAARPGGAHG